MHNIFASAARGWNARARDRAATKGCGGGSRGDPGENVVKGNIQSAPFQGQLVQVFLQVNTLNMVFNGHREIV